MPKTLTKSEFIIRAKGIHGDKYDYFNTIYIHSKAPIAIECKMHGIFQQIPNDHLNGHGCPECGKSKRYADRNMMTTEEFIIRSKEIHGDRFDYSKTKFVNTRTKLIVICNKHNLEIFQYPLNNLSGTACPYCADEARGIGRALTQEEFINDCKVMHGDKYDYSEANYINSRQKITIRCRKHDFKFTQVANLHKRGAGCPICKSSKGERTVRNTLIRLNIDFTEQKTFSGLTGISGYPLFFDFYLPKYMAIIEFDGELHSVAYEHFGGKKRLDRYKEYDRLKNEYCIANNIHLLRILYTEKDRISELVENFIKYIDNENGICFNVFN